MTKVSEHYFNEYKINITKFSTLPSLSIAIFGGPTGFISKIVIIELK